MDSAAKLAVRAYLGTILLVLLAALSAFAPGRAYALGGGCSLGNSCQFYDGQDQAYAGCLALDNSLTSPPADTHCYASATHFYKADEDAYYDHVYQLHYGGGWIEYAYHCNSGTTWNPTTKTCASFDCSQLTNPSSPDYVNPSTVGLTPLSYSGAADKCINGCRWSMTTTPRVTTSLNGVLVQALGIYKPTGDSNTCSGTPTPSVAPAADTPNPKCRTYDTGQQFCKYADGHECFTATTGRQICWGQGQTGNKTDGPVNQQRVAGGSASTPPPPPAGDTLAQAGTSGTSTTTSNPGTTVTTTTTNYITVNGTDAGSSNQGQASGSTPTDTTSSTTSASSATGGNCSASYTCSSSNGVECAILEEARKTACGVADKDGITAATNCTTAPACTGAKCNAEAYAQVVEQWKTRCIADAANGKLDGISAALVASNGKLDTVNSHLQDIAANGQGDTITDGNACVSAPTCSGSRCGGEAYKSLVEHWKTKCHVSDIKDKLSSMGATASSINSALRDDFGTPDGQDDSALGTSGTAAGNGIGEEHETGAEGLDQSGLGLPRTCPTPPTFTLAGHEFAINMTYICFAPSIESYLLLLIVGISCLFFIAKE